MVANPELCLALDEWKGRFSSWISATTPEAVINSTIFLYFLTMNALQVVAPLGKISRFSTERGRIDLRAQGTRLFVGIARELDAVFLYLPNSVGIFLPGADDAGRIPLPGIRRLAFPVAGSPLRMGRFG